MVEHGKSENVFIPLKQLTKKVSIMGVGAIVIATVFLCIAFLLLAEIQERYL